MKALTVAAAAALLGSVQADGWESWSSSADPVETPKFTTPEAETKTTTTWSEWTTSTPVKETSIDPSTWSEWSSTPDAETKTSTDPLTWSEWSTTTTTTDPWGEWESETTPAAKTTTDPSKTWSEWESESTPVVATKTDPAETWSEWEPTETVTSTSTQWITVTVYPATDGSTWSEWAPATSTDPLVVSSTVTETGTWGAWETTPLAASTDGACKVQVSLSYGPAVWFPTPVLAATANTTTWGEWETTSTPAAASTDPVTWSEWETTPAAETSTASVTWSEWSTTPDPVVATSTESWTAWTEAAASTPVVATSATTTWAEWTGTSSGDWSQSTNGISANGDKFGMTYSPYTAESGCKDAGTVASDIAAIAGKGFTSVRVYSTDCDTLENVGSAAREHGIKVILGVFISETGISGAQPQVDAIAKWAQWDLVELIVVGNEAVFQKRCSAGELAGFIGSAKSTFKGAGYTGAISTTDELSVWQGEGAAWCDVVDVVTANLYAFFNPNTRAEDAGSFIQAQINDLSQICPGKEVYVMESGWPSAGECNGVACPSPENQATAIKGIQSSSGAKVVFFSFEDEQWKAPGQFNVEQHWGCGDVFSSSSW